MHRNSVLMLTENQAWLHLYHWNTTVNRSADEKFRFDGTLTILFFWLSFPTKISKQVLLLFFVSAHRNNFLITDYITSFCCLSFPCFPLLFDPIYTYKKKVVPNGFKRSLGTRSLNCLYIPSPAKKSGFQIYSLPIILETNLYQWQMRDYINKSRISSVLYPDFNEDSFSVGR